MIHFEIGFEIMPGTKAKNPQIKDMNIFEQEAISVTGE
jgi:hypothetical protein